MTENKPITLIAALSSANFARLNCLRTLERSPERQNVEHATEWSQRHGENISSLVADFLPSGSGFDGGTQFDFDRSAPECLRFNTAFHHMSESGMYSRWTEHAITVRPSLCFGFLVTVGGRDYRDIKSYIAETFESALSAFIIATLEPGDSGTLPTVSYVAAVAREVSQ